MPNPTPKYAIGDILILKGRVKDFVVKQIRVTAQSVSYSEDSYSFTSLHSESSLTPSTPEEVLKRRTKEFNAAKVDRVRAEFALKRLREAEDKALVAMRKAEAEIPVRRQTDV